MEQERKESNVEEPKPKRKRMPSLRLVGFAQDIADQWRQFHRTSYRQMMQDGTAKEFFEGLAKSVVEQEKRYFEALLEAEKRKGFDDLPPMKQAAIINNLKAMADEATRSMWL